MNLFQIYNKIKENYEEGIELFRRINQQENIEKWFYEKILFLACEIGKKELLEMIIEKEYHYIHKQDVKGRSLLILSILYESYDCVMYLMKLPEYKTLITDKEGNTFFHYLVQNEWSETTQILFQTSILLQKELFSMKNEYGETPLHLACLKGNIQCIKLLVENGASLYELTNDSLSILHYAYQSEKNTEEIILYLEKQMELFPNLIDEKPQFISRQKQKSKQELRIQEYLFHSSQLYI